MLTPLRTARGSPCAQTHSSLVQSHCADHFYIMRAHLFSPSHALVVFSILSLLSPDPVTTCHRNATLVFHHKHRGGSATSFGLLNGPGILRGQLRHGSQSQGDSVVTDTGMVMLPDLNKSTGDGDRGASSSGAGRGVGAGAGVAAPHSSPIGLALTHYHYLLLYPDAVVALSRVNSEVVWQEHFDVRVGCSCVGFGL